MVLIIHRRTLYVKLYMIMKLYMISSTAT